MYKFFLSWKGKDCPCLLTKLVRIMKLTTVMLVLFACHIQAKTLAQKITYKVDNAPLSKVIKQLKVLTGYNFIFNSEILAGAPAITVDEKDAAPERVFTQCFTAIGLNFVINREEGTVVLNKKTKFFSQATAPPVVNGVVADDKGQPVSGATIQVKGSSVSAITNALGKFTINVSDTARVLVISMVGYETQEVRLSAAKVLNIVLKATDTRLDDIIVVGYGTQKRSQVTGAVASLSADAITERAVTRVDQALVGQIAGVNVKQTTGLPGKGFSIQVRGASSISANNEPLYVLDGFPLGQVQQDNTGGFSGGNPLDNVNPEDIESIEVLKDAAAAAIYGSRGSNGVVLITTKRGKVGKAKIQVSASVGFSEANRKVDMLSGEEWADRATEMINAAYVKAYGSRGATAADDSIKRRSIIGSTNTSHFLDSRWALPGHPGLKYVDWQDEIFRRALQQNYQLSASGGTNNVNYFFSMNHIRQEGIVIGTSNTMYSARANVEASLSQKLKIGINVSPSYSIVHDPGMEGKDVIFHQALSISPVVEDTSGVNTNAYNEAPYRYSVQHNSPVAKALTQVGETKRARIIASVYGIYSPVKGLTLKSSANFDNSNSAFRKYSPYTVNGLPINRTAANPLNLVSGGFNTNNYQSFVNENTATYSTSIKKNHNLNFLLGQSFNYFWTDNSVMNSADGYTHSTLQNLFYAVRVTGRTSASKNVLLSYFSRAQYNFRGKYLLSASLRTDGSSRFGANNRWGVFPAGSLGWKMSDEKFIRAISFINDLKVRLTYGVTGNNSIGDINALATMTNYNAVIGGAFGSGQAPNRLGNPDLRWEKSATKDIGLDFGILKNRISGSFDYYNRLTTDLLLNVSSLAITGFASYLNNAGSVRNKGWELQLYTKNVTGKFQWNTNLQLAHNTNRVVSLADGQVQTPLPALYATMPTTILRVGESINSIYVVKQTGILTQADINAKAALFGNQEAGDPKYEDFDKNGVIDANDRQIVGHPNPDYTWGITNTFNYKGFDLRVLVQGQMGGSVYSLLGRAISKTDLSQIFNVTGDHRNRWRSAENPGDGLRGKAFSNFTSIPNTDWMYSSDYFRVRTITLGYDMKKLFSTGAVSSARIFVSAENFFGHDKYYGGANPESANTDLSGSGNYPQSGDYGGLPLPKSLILGLNISF